MRIAARQYIDVIRDVLPDLLIILIIAHALLTIVLLGNRIGTALSDDACPSLSECDLRKRIACARSTIQGEPNIGLIPSGDTYPFMKLISPTHELLQYQNILAPTRIVDARTLVPDLPYPPPINPILELQQTNMDSFRFILSTNPSLTERMSISGFELIGSCNGTTRIYKRSS